MAVTLTGVKSWQPPFLSEHVCQMHPGEASSLSFFDFRLSRYNIIPSTFLNDGWIAGDGKKEEENKKKKMGGGIF